MLPQNASHKIKEQEAVIRMLFTVKCIQCMATNEVFSGRTRQVPFL